MIRTLAKIMDGEETYESLSDERKANLIKEVFPKFLKYIDIEKFCSEDAITNGKHVYNFLYENRCDGGLKYVIRYCLTASVEKE